MSFHELTRVEISIGKYRAMWKRSVCLPETSRRSAVKADKMGGYRKFRVVVAEYAITTQHGAMEGKTQSNLMVF